jgi:phosphoglycerate dehydrogenase-like enzyme
VFPVDARVSIEPVGAELGTRVDEEVARRRREHLTAVVEAAGGSVVPVSRANALLWLAVADSQRLLTLLDANPQIAWVQLSAAGVDTFGPNAFSRPVIFTSAKGAFGVQVAEHALMLILASLRHVVEHARQRQWHGSEPETLAGKRVTILGAGGIAIILTRLLHAAGCHVTVVRRRQTRLADADVTVSTAQLHDVLPNTDVLVVALALTKETHRLIGRHELELLPAAAILVNVARGAIVDTEALVVALRTGGIRAAGLDVTDPEPLPPAHALWSLDNVLVTSHCADSVSYVTEMLAERVSENVRRFQHGLELVGVVDSVAGY